MKLYHGTGERVARIAWKEGLLSRENQGLAEDEGHNWAHNDMPSGWDRIYLTTVYGPYFAFGTSDENERWAVLEIETDLWPHGEWVPDEDFLEQVSRRPGSVPTKADSEWGPLWEELHECGEDMRKRTAWWRDNAHHFTDMWEKSVEGLGNCAVYNEVPPEAITRIAFLDPNASDRPIGNKCAMALIPDPMISVMNYQICGDKYRALTEWFFGAEVDEALVTRLHHLLPGMLRPEDDLREHVERWAQRDVEVWVREALEASA
jgi:hypothetical protein